MSAAVQVGVVGLGYWGPNLARNFDRMPGAQLAYHDPYVARLAGSPAEPMDLDDGVSWADVVVIVTAHPDVDHARVAEEARLVVDLRGVTRGARPASVERL